MQQHAEVIEAIKPMAGWGKWGAGLVQFKGDDGANDGEPVEVENRFPTPFPVGSSVSCERSFDPPRVVKG